MAAAVSTPTSLWSGGERDRTGPAPYDESEYDTLDRSARPYLVEVRRTLDGWFGNLPEFARASVRARFTSSKPAVHRGGLLELYLNQTFGGLGLEVDLDIGREDPACRRPDLLLEPDRARTWVEATAVLGADVFSASERQRVQQLYDLLNRCRDKRFLLAVDVGEAGGATLGRKQVLDPLERWLSQLEPAVVRGATDAGGPEPELCLTPGDWVITIGASPVRADMPLSPDERVIGTSMEGVSQLDDVGPLRRNLKRKAGHYGQLDAPYMIAALCAGSFVEDEDIAAALLGDSEYVFDRRVNKFLGVRLRNGLWHGPTGPVNKRVSAVITIPQLAATSIVAVEPTLWVNPWAERSLELELPWRRQEIAADGRITTHAATRSAAEVLGLPSGWPHGAN